MTPTAYRGSVDLGIDFRSKTPAYEQLASKIRAAIASDVLKRGQAIPSLKNLIAETGLSAGTVQRALGLLEAEGKVVRVHGRGTFVTEGTPAQTGR